MFGYPTGLGCLIAKHDKLRKLERPWFAGGTIQVASVAACDHFMADGPPAFEDGTVNYLAIPAIEIGLRHMLSVGLDAISTRVRCLTDWLIDGFLAASHSNGQPLAKILGPRNSVDRGGTVTVTLLDPDGDPYSGARIEELAGDANISLRTGCFCNPGAGEVALGVDTDLMKHWFERPKDVGFQELVTEVRELTGKELSAIRTSVGIATNFNDVYYLMRFLDTLRDRSVADIGVADDPLHHRDSA
jgi:selenocysteine lyase/cysteine desulfurase